MNRPLLASIWREVHELNHDQALTPEQEQQLAMDLESFVTRAATKFINGQREHGGNITDRDLFKELENEIIDSFHYNRANMRKHQ